MQEAILEPANVPELAAPGRRFLDAATRSLAVAIGFSIPISTSLSEILTTLFILCWLLAGNFSEQLRRIARNPVAIASTAMFFWLALGTTWSTASWSEAGRCLLKYREFLYLPMLATVFAGDRQLRRLGLISFYAGAVTLLALSYGEWLLKVDIGMPSTYCDFVVTKDRIIHGLLMSFLVYCSAQEIIRDRSRWWIYAGMIALAAPNVLLLIQGRTGYLLLGLLTILVLAQQFGRRGFAVACVLVACTGCGAYALSGAVQQRVHRTLDQINHQFGGPREGPWDPRLDYYTTTLKLLRRHPLVGTGTGSFSSQYRELAEASKVDHTTDPHNEYLHLAVQLGIPGAIAFAGLLALQWRSSRRLSDWDGRLARGAVLTIAVGSMFNSLILSITGGLVFGYFGGMAFADLCGDAPEAADGVTPQSAGAATPFSMARRAA